MKRLLDEGYIRIFEGLSLINLGYKMAMVGLEIKSDEARKGVESLLKGCSRVLTIFRITESKSTTVYIGRG